MNKNQSCTDCGQINCKYQDKTYPEFCKTKDLTKQDIEDIEKLYQNPKNYEVARVSAEVEAEFYGNYTRVEEIIEFARRLNFKKIGIASCVGLINESRIFAKILRKNDFEAYTALCKIGSMKKVETLDLSKNVEITGEIMCNPILQAKILNNEDTELNVVIGLCVGHDSLFYKYSESLTTTLITKDRVLAHNPAGALYQTKSYYKKLLK